MPTAPGYADISLELTLTGFNRSAYVTFGVDPVDTDPLLVAASVLAAVQGAVSLKSVLDSNVTMTAIHVSMGTDGAEDLSVDYATSVVGSASAISAPPNCAALIHKRTARGGRRGRGRMFLPWCVSTGDIDEKGVIQASKITSLGTAMTNFHALLATNNVPMFLLHKPGLSAVGVPNAVTSLQVDPLIGTQRRRIGR